MDFRKYLAIALAGAMALTLAAGCTGGAEAENGDGAPAAGAEEKKDEDGDESSMGKPGTELAAATSAAGMTTAAIKVKGMDCTSCAGEVDSVVSAIDGVKDCTVEPSGTVTVTFDEKKANTEKIVAAVNEKTRYQASTL